MNDQRRAWDLEYSKPHPLWKGPPTEGSLPRDGRVLELGCGNGKTLSALTKGGCEVIGLDFSRKGLEACRRTASSGNLSLVESDAANLPFVDGSMDHIVAFHVLGHMACAERSQAVAEMARVLRPKGTIALRVFSRDDMRCGVGQKIEAGTYLRGNGIPCHFFTITELKALFSSFRVLAEEEVRAPKRYDGRDLVRSELFFSFAKDAP